MKAVGQLIELRETGRHTAQPAAARTDRLDLVIGGLQQIAQRLVILGALALGDLIDGLLGGVHDVGDLALAGVAQLGDLDGRVDQPPQHRLVMHDLGVVGGIRGDRDGGQQVRQVDMAAHLAELTAPVEFGCDGDGVCRIAVTVEVDDRLIDQLMGGAVEVGRFDDLQHLGDGVLAHQHGPQHALFGGEVLWWGAVDARWCGGWLVVHAVPPPSSPQ